jgi:hypothetical protein
VAGRRACPDGGVKMSLRSLFEHVGVVKHGQDVIVHDPPVPVEESMAVQPPRDIDGTQPERADREGDSQPLPTRNDHPDVQSAVIADIQARRDVGIARYGTPLQPFNGRNALQDLYEELLDAACYAKQKLVETEQTADSNDWELVERMTDVFTRKHLQFSRFRDLVDPPVLREELRGVIGTVIVDTLLVVRGAVPLDRFDPDRASG